ncbi:HAD-IIA family hydrolase [Pseudonocardia sp. GCM10023141]|uniref:HAD-IIA family hydrolase n=1 Tax=Pseudonocardia sp. GCM10023141 TaxID=3252653 RepID=UPI0036067E3C
MTGPAVLHRPDRIYDGYGLDLDGTVYLDDALLPGAAETIRALRGHGARIVFATNKPLATAATYAAKLTALGVEARVEDVVTALDSLVRYLTRTHPGARLLMVAEPLVGEVCRRAGFAVVTEPDAATVVVVSFDRTFDYAKLLAAYRAVRRGAVIVATNPDPYCPTADGGLPDCAAMLAAVEACTGRAAEAVVGKPSTHMGAAILERLGVAPEHAAMVGDRLATDVAMGQCLGMAGVLVLSGATRIEDVAGAPAPPDFVVPTLAEVIPHTGSHAR